MTPALKRYACVYCSDKLEGEKTEWKFQKLERENTNKSIV